MNQITNYQSRDNLILVRREKIRAVKHKVVQINVVNILCSVIVVLLSIIGNKMGATKNEDKPLFRTECPGPVCFQPPKPVSHNTVPPFPSAKSREVKGGVIAITSVIKDKRMLEFITHNEVLRRAVEVQNKTGLSAATVLAQKFFECGGGTSKFCAKTKNLSNIKCFNKQCQKANWKGPKAPKKRGETGSITAHCIQLYDDVPSDRFVRFDTFWEGWEGYSSLINRTYSKAASKTSILEEIKGLKARGFATKKSYVADVYGLAQRSGVIELQKYIDQGYTITSLTGTYVYLKQ